MCIDFDREVNANNSVDDLIVANNAIRSTRWPP